MILGSGYDYHLSRKLTRKKNVIYDLEKHGKLDHLTNGDPKVNGKGVNNQEFFYHLLVCHHLYQKKRDNINNIFKKLNILKYIF